MKNLVEEFVSNVGGAGTHGEPQSQRYERGEREHVHQGVQISISTTGEPI